jgi:type IV pilus assembly protein PilV
MRRRHCPAATAGFSLVEVMVAVMVISVGLLGVAKMQGLALSSTTNARMRSLAALQAASLASTMSADRTYWAAGAAPLTVNIDIPGATVAATDATLQTAPGGGCTSSAAPCSSAQIAAQDLKDWVTSLNGQLANGTAVINCSAATAASPVNCTIVLQWVENLVAPGAQTAAQSSAMQAVASTSYTLYVTP